MTASSDLRSARVYIKIKFVNLDDKDPSTARLLHAADTGRWEA
jgi:hypothetical protein